MPGCRLERSCFSPKRQLAVRAAVFAAIGLAAATTGRIAPSGAHGAETSNISATPNVAATPESAAMPNGAAAAPRAAPIGAADERFLDGLRRRGLYTLAEAYCRRELARDGLDERRRAELVVELSRSIAEQAACLPPAERDARWKAAAEVVEQFARELPASPYLPLVRFQEALGLLARGELARQESDLLGAPPAALEEARGALRAAVRALENLGEEVERRWRERNRPGGQRAAGPSADELHALLAAIQFELARALRNQALCYPDGSDDRTHALLKAVERLEPLAGREPPDALAWKSRVDLVTCRRLLDQRVVAGALADSYLRANPPAEALLRLRAEQMRLALAESVDRAVAMLPAERSFAGQTSAELDLARLEICLAAWRAASRGANAAEADRWLREAEQVVSTMEAEHGPFWKRRAERLLAATVGAAGGAADTGVLVRVAEDAFRAGRLDEAVAAYDRAAQATAASGDASRAFELGYIAATIEHQRNAHAEASRRYEALALGNPTHPAAANAHLLAIHHAAQQVRQGQSGAEDRYAALIEEHLRRWGESPSADEARFRLGQILRQRRDWRGAIAAFRSVGGETHREEGVEAAIGCYRRLIEAQRAAGENAERTAQEAADWLASLARAGGGPSGGAQGDPRRRCAVEAARLYLDGAEGGAARAVEVLHAALDASPDAPESWRREAQTIMISALAALGRFGEAGEVLRHLAGGGPGALVETLESLERLSRDSDARARAELANLRLQLVEQLAREAAQLDAGEKRRVDLARAAALADADRRDDALRAYGALVGKNPRDAAIRRSYAELLGKGEDRAELLEALQQWRALEPLVPENSPAWWRAKFELARTHYRLGNSQQAARIIVLLRVLHPELGGQEMKRRFDALLEQCGSP